MIASLPMYATARTAGATARLWAGIRDALRAREIAAPNHLTLDIPDLARHWLSPDLVLSQTCGLPFRLWLAGRVTLVGTPDYGVGGCPPGHYRSLVVARADDPRETLERFRGAIFACNDPHSQSGWAALATERPEVPTGAVHFTGSHCSSARAVRDARADFAALDAVTWRLMAEAGETEGLRVVHATPPAPGLPLITAAGRDAALHRAAIAEAIAALGPDDRRTLGLRGIVDIPAEAYLALATPAAPVHELPAS